MNALSEYWAKRHSKVMRKITLEMLNGKDSEEVLSILKPNAAIVSLQDYTERMRIKICPPRGNARLLRHQEKMRKHAEMYQELNDRFGTRYRIPGKCRPEYLWVQSQIMCQC